MPIFTFKCTKCLTTEKKLISSTIEAVNCSKCGDLAKKQIPKGVASTTFEMADNRRGKHIRKGIDKQLKKRMNDHHDRYELAEKIDKHGMDDAKKHGWLKKHKKI